MVVKRIFILLSILALSTGAYAQKGLTKKTVQAALSHQVASGSKLAKLRDGVRNASRRLGRVATSPDLASAGYAQKELNKALEHAVQRQELVRVKLPTVRDGMRNLLTRRLGGASTVATTPILIDPTRSVLKFGEPLPDPQARIVYTAFFDVDFLLDASENLIKRSEFFLEDSFDAYITPGSGDISAVALEPSILIDARKTALENYKKIKEMEWMLDKAFVEKDGLQLAPGYSFERVHKMIQYVKNKCPFYVSSKEIALALDVIDIQAWMLEHEGRFPQMQAQGMEFAMAVKFERLLEKTANDPEFAKGVVAQSLVRHLVHLQLVGRGFSSPLETVGAVLKHVDNGGRIPGVSPVNVGLTENQLTHELNQVEYLRRANLLPLVLPMKKSQDVVEMYMQDFQERGYIYQQMIQVIPEFANDGKTLNVPTRDALGWKHALQEWQKARAAQGLSQEPRAFIAGRFGLPVNFNDLSNEEKTEVLLGTWLRIQK